jgi:hypothetical protein
VLLFDLCFECHFVSLVFPDSVDDYRCYGRLSVVLLAAPHPIKAWHLRFSSFLFYSKIAFKDAVKGMNKIID